MTQFGQIPAMTILSVLTLAAPAVASEQHETERVDRTVSIRAGGQLRLNNFSGKVTITGSNRSDIVVHAVRRAPRERLDHIRLEIVETGSGVSIEANKKDDSWRERDNNVVETELDIQVPADVSLNVNVFSSDVLVKDVRGSQRLHTFSGEIEVGGAEGGLDAETFSGGIAVSLVQGASASVDFDSFSGSLRSDVPLSYRSASRRHVRGNIGSGGTDYHFKTFSGDVRIR
jgi:hypothetical protein